MIELNSVKRELAAYKTYVIEDEAQDKKEKELTEKEIALLVREKAVVEKERDAYKASSDKFEKMVEELLKRPGWGCTLKKILTLGIARCK